eukprot:Selendium_serpulae@DN5586_c1_g1_i2.p2
MKQGVTIASTPNGTSSAMLEPPFTNFTSSYVGCLDYVFHADDSLRLVATLELLEEPQLKREAEELLLPPPVALPSPKRPSDHLPLVAEFEWVPPPSPVLLSDAHRAV